jgi:hypothetical protein
MPTVKPPITLVCPCGDRFETRRPRQHRYCSNACFRAATLYRNRMRGMARHPTREQVDQAVRTARLRRDGGCLSELPLAPPAPLRPSPPPFSLAELLDREIEEESDAARPPRTARGALECPGCHHRVNSDAMRCHRCRAALGGG